MASNDTAQLIDSIASLVGSIAWPAAVLGVALLFRQRVRELLAEITERVKSSDVTLKAGPSGVEISTVAKSAALIGAATARRPNQQEDSREAVAASATAVARIATRSHTQRKAPPRILWVDDNPQNNIYERQALETLGFSIKTCTSTDAALSVIEQEQFDVIISDMGRPPDVRAGYTLLDELRGRNNATPFIIYASSNLPEHKAEARGHGAIGSTNDPSELITLVQYALTGE